MRSRTGAPPLVDQLPDRSALGTTGPGRSEPGQKVRPRGPPRLAPLGDKGGDGAASAADFHALPLFDPREDTRETIAEVTHGCPSHGETSCLTRKPPSR